MTYFVERKCVRRILPLDKFPYMCNNGYMIINKPAPGERPRLAAQEERLMKGKQSAQVFWAKVDIGNPDECWEWLGAINQKGYGHTSMNKFFWRSHRLAWTLTNGDIPDGLFVLHKCDNPPCCNPGHLFLGTQKDNIKDMFGKGRDRRSRGKYLYNAGSSHANSKLTEDQVVEIREMSKKMSHVQISKLFGVSDSNIGLIVRRKAWKHV